MRVARRTITLLLVLLGFKTFLVADPINIVPPGTLTGTGLVTFDDVAGGLPPGTNYNGILESGGAHFAERFFGQTLSFNGNFDVLSGSPTGPLTLQTGSPGQNVVVLLFELT